MSAEQKAGYGLLPTKDLAFRTQLCAGCHVGESGREVDHRLIAAGHPALRFELSAYQLNPVYTKHWKETNYGPDVEAWTWLIGQVGTARAAADLLRHRASEAGTSVHGDASVRDWPELAEYTCFSCHQEITGFDVKSAGRSPVRTDRPKPGTLPWGSWLYPVTLDLADERSADWTAPERTPKSLLALAELFRQTDRPRPSVAADHAAAAVADLNGWLAELQSAAERRSRSNPLSASELRSALSHAARFAGRVPETNSPSTDWDRYVQGFLATAALYRSLCVADPLVRSPEIEANLTSIAAALRFPKGQDSPETKSSTSNAELSTRWDAVRTWAIGLGPRAAITP